MSSDVKCDYGRGAVPGRVLLLVISMVTLIASSSARTRWDCIPEDGPDCECYQDGVEGCEPVGCDWPLTNPLGNLLGTADLTVGTRSCCQRHWGQSYWQILLQVSVPWACETVITEDPEIRNKSATNPEAWCSETVAFWALEAGVPYAWGYYTQGIGDAVGHHRSSFVSYGGEMRRWYLAEEVRPGLKRGRWIDARELDYANFEPGVNGPCPGAYQQIYKMNRGFLVVPWNEGSGHSQMIDSMVVYRLNASDGPVQRIDVKMIEGNIDFPDPSDYSRIIDTRWYYNIIDFTPLGTDSLGNGNKKIRGWGINLNPDGTVYCDSSRLENVVIHTIIEYPPPQPPDTTDNAYVAAMVNYFSTTGGTVDVTTNSTTVLTGGALPNESNSWIIPPPPHPEDPVCIEVDLKAEYPDSVEAVTIEWLDEIPREFTIMWAGSDATFQSSPVTLPTTAPTVPSGTVIPYTVMFTPGIPDTGYSIQYVRLCIPQSALTRTFQINKFHYNYYCREGYGDADSLSDESAGDPLTAIDEGDMPPMELWLRSGYPNPFQTGTSLAFGLPEAGTARLTIYDVRGRRIKVVLDRFVERGPHTVSWDGRSEGGAISPSGVYFARLEWRGQARTTKLVLMK